MKKTNFSQFVKFNRAITSLNKVSPDLLVGYNLSPPLLIDLIIYKIQTFYFTNRETKT